MKKMLVFILGMTVLATAYTDDAFIDTGRKKIKVKDLKSDSSGKLTFKEGRIQRVLAKSKYKYAWIPRPKDLKSAYKMMKDKKYEKAAKEFESLAKKYKYLGWDVCAIRYAGESYKDAGKTDDAIKILKKLNGYKLLNREKKEGDFMKARILLSELLIGKKSYDEAAEILDEISKFKNNDYAAYAFNGQGKMLAEKGKKKDAVSMYLITALLFPKENPYRPEAIYQVSTLLKAQNDARSKIWADMLKQDYPRSSWVSKLK